MMSGHLFSPIKLGTVELSNRICFLAHRTNFGQKGRFHDRHFAYYRRRAVGGCGLIIVGEFSIHPDDHPWASMIEAFHPGVVGDFRKLTDTIHQFETKTFAHLRHHGFQGSGAITRREVIGPSPVADIAFGETAKAMEPEDMEMVCRAFADAAVLVREGGFDGIQIGMGPESLLRQFLSPISNHRQDSYGGSLENRMRLPMEVIAALRKAVGADFTVGVRLCANEQFYGGISIEESQEMAKAFEDAGMVDFINVAVGTYYNLHLIQPTLSVPFGFTLDTAAQIKHATSLPVMAGHQIDTPQMAEDILASGRADMVGLVRNLICDPDAPRKAKEGRFEDIRYCVRDNQGCIGRVNRSKAVSCIQNPAVGYEQMGKEENARQSEKVKTVMVVGGGPAGMEAARAAARRGHQVTLYEKDDRVGGQIHLQSRGSGREKVIEVALYLERQLKILNVAIETGAEVTPEMVKEKNPDAVIIATGSRPVAKPVAGEYGPPFVVTVRDVLAESFPMGDRVLFVDENGGYHATATVEWLADQGVQVDMVTSELFIGMEVASTGDLYLTRQRLLQKGVTFTTDVIVDEISGRSVQGRNIYTNEPVSFDGYDTVVLDMGQLPMTDLYFKLKNSVKELCRVGDCVAPRNIEMAIFEGRKAGEAL
jgi:mycofactocin system FadH/OYE family oxidoreductase 2